MIRLRPSKFTVIKLIEILILMVYYMYTIPFGFSLFWHFLGITFRLFKLLCCTKDHWWRFSTRNAHMVHIVNYICNYDLNGVYILEDSFYILIILLNSWGSTSDWSYSFSRLSGSTSVYLAWYLQALLWVDNSLVEHFDQNEHKMNICLYGFLCIFGIQ